MLNGYTMAMLKVRMWNLNFEVYQSKQPMKINHALSNLVSCCYKSYLNIHLIVIL